MSTSVPGHGSETEPKPGQTRLLGVASQVYVISLLERQDRREEMERLRAALGISWTIIDATSFTNPLVSRLFDWIVLERRKLEQSNTVFSWPREINALSVLTNQPLSGSGSDLWTTTPLPESTTPSSSSIPHLICTTDDCSMPPEIYDFLILTPARVACWHSHVSAIRTFVDRGDMKPDDVAIILEDDVDVEKDIADQLCAIWKDLPTGWDIVLLGHCWSNEAFYPPIPTANTNITTRLHPSNSPKCTHGYALSLTGARRLLQHLRYPPFAYSRSIDTAFSWLIESGRLRAYSVVPSVVVQTKTTASDILPGAGSKWKDGLMNGALA